MNRHLEVVAVKEGGVKMSNNKTIIPAILLFVFLVVGSSAVFTVQETEKAILFRLGQIVKADFEPGIHFKTPFINNVKKFDSRILTLDSRPERFLTSEKKNVIVDSFVKWRISNVSVFYTSVTGDIRQANLRLDQIIKDAFRGEFSKRTIKDLVSTDREKIREILLKKINPVVSDLGIEINDIRIKRIDLPDEVRHSVYRRMEAERARVARDFRSRGAEAAERIRADADRQREVIMANAFRDAEITKGNGDAIATATYAKAYNANMEFFAFYRSLEAYKKTFSEGGLLVLEPDSDFFSYFKNENGKQ